MDRNLIRRLRPGEGALYRELRLEALRDSPQAFGSRHADAVARSPGSWNEQADTSSAGRDRATFVMFDGKPVGLVALYRNEDAPDEGELIQMWIAREKRGGVAATDLLGEVLCWGAINGFLRVRAEVLGGNPGALRFYEKCGFKRADGRVDDGGDGVVLIKELEGVGGAGM